ncbi:MAG: bifunctional (p)ppGpp synthetase/guanosine-3',5'-bis(diphosphate) 3'-pyrophosphohydrolase [Muribaculaceae bacterium]|nr:bifunctional (p)ppGpp synthetase/guanosine-3',5'-bis(diphosphate) 3'-pyrophosphohydrolase [Muribaculaceae bacterium]
MTDNKGYSPFLQPVEGATSYEDKVVDAAFRDLLKCYVESNHRKKVEIIEKAFKFAKEAHKGARRRSGEPYILHPIAVARIVVEELGLGSTSICAALLHDVIEDTAYTREDIEIAFGKRIADIVEGVTKISGGIFGDKASVQAESFRKLLLSMSTDIRVILVKMADRLHNMRTLGSLRPEKQFKIAGETLYVYAPLAHRLGLSKIKYELEDLAFKYEHPQKYREIIEKINETEEHREAIVEKFVTPIRRMLDEAGFKYEIKARVKSAYSIYKKMENKKIPFEEIYDVYAVRVIFENDDDSLEKLRCWQIYTFFTEGHKLHPERLRDWVSVPKANGYRALHLTAMGPEGKWIEVQIRSRKMDEIAELGYAAHWKYKDGVNEDETELDTWMNTIKDILAHPEPNALDFLDTIKLNLFSTEIYVFTPKGDLLTLPKGATVLDMAFAIHSQLGLHCMAGKISHKLVPLSHELQSGDQVELITSNSRIPTPEWMDFCHTAKAKTRIRTFLKKANNVEILTPEEMERIATPESSQEEKRSLVKRLLRNPFSSKKKKGEKKSPKIDRGKVFRLYPDDKEPNYHIETCCSPLPGDEVLGFVNEDEEVVLHKVECPIAMRLKSVYGSRLVMTEWGGSSSRFMASVELDGIDRRGILEEIVDLVSHKFDINIRSMNISTSQEVFHCEMSFFTDTAERVDNLCESLLHLKGIKFAHRKG